MPKDNMYVCEVSEEQSAALRAIIENEGTWEIDVVPYSRWRARKSDVSVTSYTSGKLVVQGKGTGEFVQFTLETQVLKQARYGYENVWAQIENKEMFTKHAGTDESGKGDFLGPLVIACACTDETSADFLLKNGVADSKTIKSDKRIFMLDGIIRKACQGAFSVISIWPEKYNRLYSQFANLNRLLAWGHAQALENVLELVPDCPRAISDQFASSPHVLTSALKERGRRIVFEQHPRAEADVAVAAASILARAEFVRIMKILGKELEMELPKGGGEAATAAARKIVEKLGRNALSRYAKIHFKNANDALA